MNLDACATILPASGDIGLAALAQRSSLDGPQVFARYAFMPNRLTYCGGDDNRALFDYCMAGITDPGLRGLLLKFSGAMPYLRLIARCNGIADAFDARVVEAYWLGNELLQGVEARALYDSLRTRFARQMSTPCSARRPPGRTRITVFMCWMSARATAGRRRSPSWTTAASVGARWLRRTARR
jgi:hypothetical protein